MREQIKALIAFFEMCLEHQAMCFGTHTPRRVHEHLVFLTPIYFRFGLQWSRDIEQEVIKKRGWEYNASSAFTSVTEALLDEREASAELITIHIEVLRRHLELFE